MRIELVALMLVSSAAMAEMGLQDLRNRGRTLEEGMASARVAERFGPADETESLTCGSETRHPWTCLVWTYRSARVGDLKLSYSVLTITFEKSRGKWLVNGWRWLDF